MKTKPLSLYTRKDWRKIWVAMEIQQITVYRYNNVEYTSLDKVKEAVENHLGAIIDSMDVTLTPKQKLNILKTLVGEQDSIVDLLQVEFDHQDNILYSNMVNILEY